VESIDIVTVIIAWAMADSKLSNTKAKMTQVALILLSAWNILRRQEEAG
jgi:hypothetical protein